MADHSKMVAAAVRSLAYEPRDRAAEDRLVAALRAAFRAVCGHCEGGGRIGTPADGTVEWRNCPHCSDGAALPAPPQEAPPEQVGEHEWGPYIIRSADEADRAQPMPVAVSLVGHLARAIFLMREDAEAFRGLLRQPAPSAEAAPEAPRGTTYQLAPGELSGGPPYPTPGVAPPEERSEHYTVECVDTQFAVTGLYGARVALCRHEQDAERIADLLNKDYALRIAAAPLADSPPEERGEAPPWKLYLVGKCGCKVWVVATGREDAVQRWRLGCDDLDDDEEPDEISLIADEDELVPPHLHELSAPSAPSPDGPREEQKAKRYGVRWNGVDAWEVIDHAVGAPVCRSDFQTLAERIAAALNGEADGEKLRQENASLRSSLMAQTELVAGRMRAELAAARQQETPATAAHVVTKEREGGGREEAPHSYFVGPRRSTRSEALADLAKWETVADAAPLEPAAWSYTGDLYNHGGITPYREVARKWREEGGRHGRPMYFVPPRDLKVRENEFHVLRLLGNGQVSASKARELINAIRDGLEPELMPYEVDGGTPMPDAAEGQQEGEPVAWRYRMLRSSGPWRYVACEDDCNPGAEYERQPLYAALPPAAPDERLREAAEKARGLLVMIEAGDGEAELVRMAGRARRGLDAALDAAPVAVPPGEGVGPSLELREAARRAYTYLLKSDDFRSDLEDLAIADALSAALVAAPPTVETEGPLAAALRETRAWSREEQEAESAAPSDPLYVGTLASGHDIRRCRRHRNRRFYCTCSPGSVLSGVGVERHRIAVERAAEGGEVQR